MTSRKYEKLETNTTIPTCDIEKLEPNTTIPTSSLKQKLKTCFERAAVALGLFLFIFLILSFIIFIIIFIIWTMAVLIDGAEIRIESLSVSNFNVNSSSHTINGNWNLTLDFYNGVERGIFNNGVSSSIFYESEMLDATRIPLWKQQGWHKHKLIEAGFSAVNYNVHSLVNIMNQDIAGGVISFDVKVEVANKDYWRCDNVVLAITTAASGSLSGKMIGGSKSCTRFI